MSRAHRVWAAVLAALVLGSVAPNVLRGDGRRNLYVVQAEAFLHGRLDIEPPTEPIGEASVVGGRAYVAFPPAPAVLLPVRVGLRLHGVSTGFFGRARLGFFSLAFSPFNLLYLVLQGFHLEFTSPDRLIGLAMDPFGTSLLSASPGAVSRRRGPGTGPPLGRSGGAGATRPCTWARRPA